MPDRAQGVGESLVHVVEESIDECRVGEEADQCDREHYGS